MVHEDVDPDVGAPKVTFGEAVIPPEFTVTELAFLPGVKVQLYVVFKGGTVIADACNVAGEPEYRVAPETGELICAVTPGSVHMDAGSPIN
jgi:hypothetical protein